MCSIQPCIGWTLQRCMFHALFSLFSWDKEVTEWTGKSLSYNDLLTVLSEKKSIAVIMVTHMPGTHFLHPLFIALYFTAGQMAIFPPFAESVKIIFMSLKQGLMLFSARQYRMSYNKSLENRAPLMTIVSCAWLICQEACTLPFTKPLLLHNGNAIIDFAQAGRLYDMKPLKSDLLSAILSYWKTLCCYCWLVVH